MINKEIFDTWCENYECDFDSKMVAEKITD